MDPDDCLVGIRANKLFGRCDRRIEGLEGAVTYLSQWHPCIISYDIEIGSHRDVEPFVMSDEIEQDRRPVNKKHARQSVERYMAQLCHDCELVP